MANKARKVLGIAKLKYARIAPRKARLAIDLIRGKHLNQAMQLLENSERKGAKVFSKLLGSAVANASQKGADVDTLWVLGGRVDKAPVMKRMTPRAQGRATPIKKKFAHLEIEVGSLI